MLHNTQLQTSILAQDMGEPALASQSSTTSSPRSLPEDNPFFTPEHSPHILEPSDVMIPGVFTSSDVYENALEAVKNMNLSADANKYNAYPAGRETHSSAPTYRDLYNTTPKQSNRTGSTTLLGNTGRADLNSRDARHIATPNFARSHPPSTENPSSTNLGASSAPTHPQVLDNNPGSYDINDETSPDKPYFKDDFQGALKNGKLVAKRIADILGTCQLAEVQDSHVFSMIQTANELRQFDAPSVCTVGIVGDSGAGKSSLINSLLDQPGLARTSCSGKACTQVVTEYRLRQPLQEAKYTIEVDRMTNDEINEQLRELVWSYRCFHISDLKKENASPDEKAEKQRLKSQSKVAWETLEIAFKSKRELTETYLKDPRPGALDRIQEQLEVWTSELKWPQDTSDSGWVGTANTVAECRQKTQQFYNGSLWPFVKIIRIYLSSQVLKSGCVLADLPGFHDSNHARVKAAEKYMYSCDEILVAADINRVSTNTNVENILQQSLGSNLQNGRPSQGVSLVCTKCDIYDVDEIKDELFNGEAGHDHGGDDDDGDDATSDESDYFYMTARNNHVKELIQSEFAGSFEDRSLKVFCVSSKMYKDNRSSITDLPIKSSGIPVLRAFCHDIPARAQFRIAHHFLTINLKALVQRVQLWLAGGSQKTMQNDASVQRMLETLQHNLRQVASDAVSATKDTQERNSTNIMIQPISVNLDKWTRDTLHTLSGLWGQYCPIQILYVCLHNGSWAKDPIKGREWNIVLIEPMVNAMACWWSIYAARSQAVSNQLQKNLLESLAGLRYQVKDFQGLNIFTESLETKIASIKYTFEEAEKTRMLEIERIKRDATQNHPGAYVNEEMLKAWRECQADNATKKPGVTFRRLQYLEKAVGTEGNPVLFTAMRDRLDRALLDLVAKMTDKIKKEVSVILDQIGNDLEFLRGSEAKILARNGDFLEKLSRVVTAVMADMKKIEETAALVKSDADGLDV